MKGMMASLLFIFCATGMVVAQQSNPPSSAQSIDHPISYELPVDANVLDGIKREGWRKANLERQVRGWVHEIVFRNPQSRSTLSPGVLEHSDGIRDRSLFFVVDDQQLEMMRTGGLKYRVRPEEVPAFDAIVLVYKSPYPTVPMSPEMASRDNTGFPESTAPPTRSPSRFAQPTPPAARPIPSSPPPTDTRRTDSTLFARSGDQDANHNHEHLDNLGQFDPHPAASSSSTLPPSDWQSRSGTQFTDNGANRDSGFLDGLPERDPGATANNGFRPRVLESPTTRPTSPSSTPSTRQDWNRQNQEYEAQLANQREREERWRWEQQQIEEQRRLAAKREELQRLEQQLEWERNQLRRQSTSINPSGVASEASQSAIAHPTYQYPNRHDNDFRLADQRLSQPAAASRPPRRTPVSPVTTGPWPTSINGPQTSPTNTAATPVATTQPMAQLLAQYGLANASELETFLKDNSKLLAKVEKMEQLKKTNGFLWFMLLCAIGLSIYLSWIARGFYVRYAELADELRETFTSTLS